MLLDCSLTKSVTSSASCQYTGFITDWDLIFLTAFTASQNPYFCTFQELFTRTYITIETNGFAFKCRNQEWLFHITDESSTWIGLTSPYNQTHSPSSNVTGRLFDYHDNSTFIHDSAIMGGINVNANGLCVFMKSNSETNFAGTKSCENEYTYLCQIRIV